MTMARCYRRAAGSAVCTVIGFNLLLDLSPLGFVWLAIALAVYPTTDNRSRRP